MGRAGGRWGAGGRSHVLLIMYNSNIMQELFMKNFILSFLVYFCVQWLLYIQKMFCNKEYSKLRFVTLFALHALLHAEVDYNWLCDAAKISWL